LTDEELIRGCIREDESAQRELFRRYAGKMLAVCQRYARNSMDAEDIVQDAFIKVFDKLKQFKFEGSFEGWVRKIVVNTALKKYTVIRYDKEVMSNSDRYLQQLNKVTERLEVLEAGKSISSRKKTNPDEDWEELYYEVQTKKEKLENELDLTEQSLQQVEEKMIDLERKEQAFTETLSGLEVQLESVNALQNKIDLLQRQLEGAKGRESDLQQQLEQELSEKEQYLLMEKDYVKLQSEADELKRALQELGNRNRLSEQKLRRLTELESTLDATEYEKSDLRKTVEEIIMENEALSMKLQELQDKLGTEKYA